MIEAISGNVGVPRAKAICDDCGREEVTTCDYERKSGNMWQPNAGQMHRKMQGAGWALVKGRLYCPACKGTRKQGASRAAVLAAIVEGFDSVEGIQSATGLSGANTRQVLVRLASEGVIDRIGCGTYGLGGGDMSQVTSLRQPTREQKRQIMSLLEVSYDTDAGRYKGTDTDNTIAETIGGGVMPGWVAEVREEFFGPDGGNGEMDGLLADMRAWVKARETEKHNAKVHIEQAEAILRTVDDRMAEVAGFAKRVEAIQKAVGPKAGRA